LCLATSSIISLTIDTNNTNPKGNSIVGYPPESDIDGIHYIRIKIGKRRILRGKP
jgi:hypothetical protein